MQNIQFVFKVACIFFRTSETFKWFHLHCPRQMSRVTLCDKWLTRIVKDVSRSCRAEISPVKLEGTRLINNNMFVAEILCGGWSTDCQALQSGFFDCRRSITWWRRKWKSQIYLHPHLSIYWWNDEYECLITFYEIVFCVIVSCG